MKREREDLNKRQREEAQSTKPKKADDNRGSMEVLGLESGFTQADLKKAYHEKSKRYHPNLWQNDPEDIQKAMEEEQKKVNAAYAMLKGVRRPLKSIVFLVVLPFSSHQKITSISIVRFYDLPVKTSKNIYDYMALLIAELTYCWLYVNVAKEYLSNAM